MALFLWLSLFVCNLASAKEHHSYYTKQNKSFFFPKYRPEIFYDNKVLPEDIEIDAIIIKDQTQRLFYILEGGYRPLSLTVTPCSPSPLEWRLSHQALPVSAATSNSFQSDPWYNQVVYPQQMISSSPSATYTGTERRSYTNPRAPPGLYVLELHSAVTARAKVVVTTRSCTDYSYHPSLPTVHAVQLVKAKRNRVLISWNPSASTKPVEYCVTSNTDRNYLSFCAANADFFGDHSLLPPSGFGFGFHWEKSAKRTIQTNFSTQLPKNNVSLSCVGRKTWHMFKGLERGKTYYFDVFAIDMETNASTAYVGVKASVKNSPKPPLVKDDSLITFTLDNTNGYSATTKYHGGKTSGTILLFVQSCTGPGPVLLTMMRNSASGKAQEILNERIMDIKTLEIPQHVAPSNTSFSYTLNVRSTMNVPRQVRIWISGKKTSFSFSVIAF